MQRLLFHVIGLVCAIGATAALVLAGAGLGAALVCPPGWQQTALVIICAVALRPETPQPVPVVVDSDDLLLWHLNKNWRAA